MKLTSWPVRLSAHNDVLIQQRVKVGPTQMFSAILSKFEPVSFHLTSTEKC